MAALTVAKINWDYKTRNDPGRRRKKPVRGIIRWVSQVQIDLARLLEARSSDAIISQYLAKPDLIWRGTSTSIGEEVQLALAERIKLGIGSLRPYDVDWRTCRRLSRLIRNQRKRERARDARRAAGMVPWSESAARLEPWKTEGISKSTYYRRKRKARQEESHDRDTGRDGGGCGESAGKSHVQQMGPDQRGSEGFLSDERPSSAPGGLCNAASPLVCIAQNLPSDQSVPPPYFVRAAAQDSPGSPLGLSEGQIGPAVSPTSSGGSVGSTHAPDRRSPDKREAPARPFDPWKQALTMETSLQREWVKNEAGVAPSPPETFQSDEEGQPMVPGRPTENQTDIHTRGETVKELFEDQAQTFEDSRETFRQGILRQVVKAPCAWGKTTFGAACIDACLTKNADNQAAFFVPRIDLVEQTWISFKADGINAGIFQGDREQDWSKRVQICSTHTCRARNQWPDKAKLVIVDECHMADEALREWLMQTGKRAIGLTATPGAKGMAKVYKTPRGDEAYWQTLVPGGNTAEMIEKGRLSPFRYFGVSYPDLKGVKSSVSQFGRDYNQKQLSERVNTAELHADIIRTYREKWGRGKTLFFGVDCLHAKTVQQRFNEAGIPAGYQDAHTPRLGHYADKDHKSGLYKAGDYIEGRNDVERKFHSGEYEVVCNVETLTTGVDWDVRCIQLGRPTKSEILLVQICGRGGRLADLAKIRARGDKLAEPKDFCLILDHTGTIGPKDDGCKDALGFPHLIDWDALDDGQPKAKADVKRKPPLPKPCSKCAFLKLPKVLTCPNCGHTPKIESGIHERDGSLGELKPGQLRKKTGKSPTWSYVEKLVFYRELLGYALLRSYKPGWAKAKYHARFGGWPLREWERESPARVVSPSTQSWIRAQNIAWAHSQKNTAEARHGG